MRYHLLAVRMAIIKMYTNNKCWRRYGEKGTRLYCWWEIVQPLWKIVWRFHKKLKREPPHDPAIPLLGKHPRKTKTLILERYTHPNVHSNIIYNVCMKKLPKCPSTEKMDKGKEDIYIHTMKAILIYTPCYV